MRQFCKPADDCVFDSTARCVFCGRRAGIRFPKKEDEPSEIEEAPKDVIDEEPSNL